MEKKPVKIYRDLWSMTYEFAVTIKSLKDYNDNDGWPVLIDDFVLYVKKMNNK